MVYILLFDDFRCFVRNRWVSTPNQQKVSLSPFIPFYTKPTKGINGLLSLKIEFSPLFSYCMVFVEH